MALDGSYLDRDEFAARLAPPMRRLVEGDFIDPTGLFEDDDKAERLEEWQSFVDAELVEASSTINGRLSKRYATPFESPPPVRVLRWLRDLVLPKLFEGRGWDPSDAQAVSILERETRALEELKEAADAKEGLFDLPLRQDTTTTGISKGEPLSYSEASPYEWLDVQRETVGS